MLEFCDFAQTLYPIIGMGVRVEHFTRTLFENITSIPDNVDPNPLVEQGDSAFKMYYTGDRKLTRLVPKIIIYLDIDKFSDYINQFDPDLQFLIFEKLGSYFLTQQNPIIANETAELFQRIIHNYAKKKASKKNRISALEAQNIQNDCPVTPYDFGLLNECGMKCPICGKRLVENKKGIPLSRYIVTPIFPYGMDIIKQSEFRDICPPADDLESTDNKILLCRTCAEDYLVSPTKEEYEFLYKKKNQQVWDLQMRDKADDIAVEQGIRQILDAFSSSTEQPIPIDRTKWEAYRVDKKIPEDNFNLRERITFWVLHYYRYLEQQFKQEERTRKLRFRKIQNEVSQCFETYDEENLSQERIFEYLVKWLEAKTDCHNRDALEAMISFFVQNCEVFYEAAE